MSLSPPSQLGSWHNSESESEMDSGFTVQDSRFKSWSKKLQWSTILINLSNQEGCRDARDRAVFNPSSSSWNDQLSEAGEHAVFSQTLRLEQKTSPGSMTSALPSEDCCAVVQNMHNINQLIHMYMYQCIHLNKATSEVACDPETQWKKGMTKSILGVCTHPDRDDNVARKCRGRSKVEHLVWHCFGCRTRRRTANTSPCGTKIRGWKKHEKTREKSQCGKLMHVRNDIDAARTLFVDHRKCYTFLPNLLFVIHSFAPRSIIINAS